MCELHWPAALAVRSTRVHLAIAYEAAHLAVLRESRVDDGSFPGRQVALLRALIEQRLGRSAGRLDDGQAAPTLWNEHQASCGRPRIVRHARVEQAQPLAAQFLLG